MQYIAFERSALKICEVWIYYNEKKYILLNTHTRLINTGFLFEAVVFCFLLHSILHKCYSIMQEL